MYGEADVYVYPSQLWSYIQDNRRLIGESTVIIAERESTSAEVVLYTDESYMPHIAAYRNGKLISDEEIIGRDDASDTCQRIYIKCFVDEDSSDEEAEENENEEVQHEINRRFNELSDALEDFMFVVTDDQVNRDSKEFEEMLDAVLDVVASYNYSVYFPCYLVAEDGTETFSPYPYEVA